jgi:hypoxanthine phosphoribosyltransferase
VGINELIRIGELEFEPFISSEVIRARVSNLAADIDRWYRSKDVQPLALVIMDGAFVFASDLLRSMETDAQPCFVKISSYKGIRQGDIQIGFSFPGEFLAHRHVLIIEDILDSGNSMWNFLENLKSLHVRDVRICSLLSKPDVLRKDIKPDWVGFEIPSDFVIGYGMDCDGMGRGLGSIYKLRSG